MKKTTILAGAAFTLLTASVNAQQTTTTTDTVPQQQTTTTTTTATETSTVSKDKYNNWSADTYKLQPMPEALTQEKIFPVIGQYNVTDKDGNASTVSISLDPSNKGLVWIDGLPQGRIKANLRKSPAVYKIPAQKLGDDPEAKDAKSIAEGVLIFDKDANTLNVCLGCTYNSENPAVAFDATAAAEQTDATAQEEAAKTAKTAKKKTTKKAAPKVAKVVPVRYAGTKVMEQTAAVQQ
ncbi:MAG: hypothetical protein DI535_17250 [Citrobacter freundii]|nr:MAG: hypothetical protein DI535_17250 [Citrobacter freundii]